jgi:hypothetical protein
MDFELKIQELNYAWIWFEFLEGFKPLREKLLNSPKFLLLMISVNVNLDWLTCIQEFEIP